MIMLAPVDAASHSCAESIRPESPDPMLMIMDQRYMAPADAAKFLAALDGTTSNAVTSRTPTAHTENITVTASNAEKEYCHQSTLMPSTLATLRFMAMRSKGLQAKK